VSCSRRGSSLYVKKKHLGESRADQEEGPRLTELSGLRRKATGLAPPELPERQVLSTLAIFTAYADYRSF